MFTAGDDIPAELLPHLLIPGEQTPLQEFDRRLRSLSVVQTFGWMEGCVLDGLLDLATLAGQSEFEDIARQHIAHFVVDDQLVYENPISVPGDGRIYGIEGTLPFAALAHLDPAHPLLDLPVGFWQGHTDEGGAVVDGNTTSSEGSYTVGYPMAVIAGVRKDSALESAALLQLRVRQQRLFDGTTFWRTSNSAGETGDRNWARGIAWQLLGQARTLRAMKHRSDLQPAITEFAELAAWALKYQRPDGLWSVFVDAPELKQDTAGSSGIAAAFGIGVTEGWLSLDYQAAAVATWAGLKLHLTPDGFLSGASQANKGGVGLQRGDYRVIYQTAMGLMAQLQATLPPSSLGR